MPVPSSRLEVGLQARVPCSGFPGSASVLSLEMISLASAIRLFILFLIQSFILIQLRLDSNLKGPGLSILNAGITGSVTISRSSAVFPRGEAEAESD